MYLDVLIIRSLFVRVSGQPKRIHNRYLTAPELREYLVRQVP